MDLKKRAIQSFLINKPLGSFKKIRIQGDGHWPELGSSTKRHVASDSHLGFFFLETV